MTLSPLRVLTLSLCLAAPQVLAGTAPDAVPLRDWAVPSPTSAGLHTLADVSGMLPFVAVTPCRVADTRVGSGFSGYYGPPALAANAFRNFPITGQCGIPTSAQAVSFNITVTNTQGPGDLRAFPQDTPAPLVSTLNYLAGQTLANAAIVPMGYLSGGLSLQADVSGTDVIIDVNGYFSSAPAGGGTFYLLTNSAGASLLAHNTSTTCSSPGCAVVGQSDSNTYYTAAVQGSSSSTTAGVYGVAGDVASAQAYAAGIHGSTTHVNSSAGVFVNNGSTPIIGTYLGYWNGATKVGLATNAQISGTSLAISGTPKNFVAPHPEDPSKEIVYAALEGPSADVYFRGTARIVDGVARVEVPEHFRLTAREGTYLATVTPLGTSGVPLAVERQDADGIVVRGRADVAFNYVVYAERDETRDQQPVRPNTHFTPEAMERVDLLGGLPEKTIQLLVRNGTLNPDGTYNRRTAERLGWTIPAPPDRPRAGGQ